MFKPAFRFLNIKPMLQHVGTGRDPFNNPQGINVFDRQQQQQQQQQGGGRMPPEGATDYVPSNIVPGQKVPGTPSTGPGGQLGNRVDNSGQSPLATYMGDDYAMYSGENAAGNGQGQPAEGGQQAPAKPKGAFDAEMSDFDSVVGTHAYVTQADEALLDKASKGDKQAMMELLNTVGRRATSSAAFLSTKVAQNGVASELQAYGEKLPTQLVEREFSNLFSGDKTGVLADPRVAPLLDSTVQQFRKQYPKAPPAKIKQAVTAYLEDLTGYKQKTSEQESKSKADAGGWDDFFQGN